MTVTDAQSAVETPLRGENKMHRIQCIRKMENTPACLGKTSNWYEEGGHNQKRPRGKHHLTISC